MHLEITQKFKYKVEDMINHYKNMEKFIDKYQPIYIQAQISNILFPVLHFKQKKKMVALEDKIYSEMNNRILQVIRGC